MNLFKKNKMPAKKKKAGKDKNNLSKYLPTTLFIGVQEDVNEKALVGYITSLSQSAFTNLKEVKYSTKKLSKNRFIYEIHNGSQNLTYLPLVVSKLIEGSEKELILKTQTQNVRVLKKTATKIESNTLISSNNRDDDAQIDLDTNGKLKTLVREGTEVLFFSILASSITGILASAGFFSKYYMLNEDYSYNPKVPEVETAYEFLESLKDEEHSEYRFLNNIRFKNGKWFTEYTEIEKPVEIVENPMDENIITDEHSMENNVKNIENNEQEENISKNIDVKKPLSELTSDERRERIKERRKQKAEERRLRREEIEKDIMSNDIMKGAIISNDVPAIEDHLAIEDAPIVKDNLAIEDAPIVDESIVEDNLAIEDAPIVDESIVEDNLAIEDTTVPVIEEENVDDFEIVEELTIEGLDLSNLPDNVLIEEGDK